MTVRGRWLLFMALVAILAYGAFLFYNPAAGLHQGKIDEVGIYTLNPYKSLHDLGYDIERMCAPLGQSDLEHNCPLIDDVRHGVIQALQGDGRASYRFGVRSFMEGDMLYVIHIKTTHGSYNLYVRDVEEAAQGTFYWRGGRPDGVGQAEARWIIYRNPSLGRILKDLRARKP